nr:hypothetical protein [Moritella viscosa]SHO14718.1 Cysteinyl-tRNA synthetase-Cysteine--tRNA ligase [Moritella viscosa]
MNDDICDIEAMKEELIKEFDRKEAKRNKAYYEVNLKCFKESVNKNVIGLALFTILPIVFGYSLFIHFTIVGIWYLFIMALTVSNNERKEEEYKVELNFSFKSLILFLYGCDYYKDEVKLKRSRDNYIKKLNRYEEEYIVAKYNEFKIEELISKRIGLKEKANYIASVYLVEEENENVVKENLYFSVYEGDWRCKDYVITKLENIENQKVGYELGKASLYSNEKTDYDNQDELKTIFQGVRAKGYENDISNIKSEIVSDKLEKAVAVKKEAVEKKIKSISSVVSLVTLCVVVATPLYGGLEFFIRDLSMLGFKLSTHFGNPLPFIIIILMAFWSIRNVFFLMLPSLIEGFLDMISVIININNRPKETNEDKLYNLNKTINAMQKPFSKNIANDDDLLDEKAKNHLNQIKKIECEITIEND